MSERTTTPIIADVVFIRTAAGTAALQPASPRDGGLSERAMQLLHMLDGTRSAVQLMRAFPERELAAYLAVLEVTGHVQPINDDAVRDLRAMYAADNPESDDMRDLFAWADLPEVDDDTPPDVPRGHLAALSAAATVGDFGTLRERVLLGMLRRMGATGESFALRIIRCDNLHELRDLIPAIASVIEVKDGADDAEQFARETQPR